MLKGLRMSGKLSANFQSLRIFLAEDDVEMRRLIAGALRADGHLVIEASDGAALLLGLGHSYWTGRPDPRSTLVISDVRMPERDGLSVLRGMRLHLHCPPFILITGFGDAELHAEAARLGAHAVFDKPFDLDDLRETVDRIARRLVEPSTPDAPPPDPP